MLDTTGIAGPAQGSEQYLAYSLVAGEWSTHPFGTWWVLPSDSIIVGPCPLEYRHPPRNACPPPFGGLWMRLSDEGGTLRGRLTSLTDALLPDRPSEISTTVVGMRVPCAR